MLNILAVWIVNALALLALPYVVPSIHVAGFGTAMLVAVVLGLINAVLRPLLVLLTDGTVLARLPSSAHPLPDGSCARVLCLPPRARATELAALAAFVRVVPASYGAR